MSVIACPTCGSGTRADAQVCWLCGASLAVPVAAPLPSPVSAPGVAPGDVAHAGVQHAPTPATRARSSGSGCFWIGGIMVSTVVLLFVGLEIGILAPGLLIPYAVLMVPIMIAFGRMIYIQLFRREAPPPPPAPGPHFSARGDVVPSSAQDTGSKVAAGVAMGLVGVMAIVGILILMFIAAVIVLFIVCLAVAGYS